MTTFVFSLLMALANFGNAAAQYEICVWPNKCAKAPSVQTETLTAQFQPCVWPNPCAVSG